MIELSEKALKNLEQLRKATESYSTLLFDVDGTLANNMPSHKAAYIAAAKLYGIDNLDPDIIDRTAGWPTIALAEEIARLYNKEYDYVEFANKKAAIFIDEFVHQTQPIDFVYAHLVENIGKKELLSCRVEENLPLSIH